MFLAKISWAPQRSFEATKQVPWVTEVTSSILGILSISSARKTTSRNLVNLTFSVQCTPLRRTPSISTLPVSINFLFICFSFLRFISPLLPPSSEVHILLKFKRATYCFSVRSESKVPCKVSCDSVQFVNFIETCDARDQFSTFILMISWSGCILTLDRLTRIRFMGLLWKPREQILL